MIPKSSSLRRAAAVLGLALASLACTSTAPTDTGFPLAYFHGDCAPWDGPALTIVLTRSEMTEAFDASYPFARISLYSPPPRLEGSTVRWSGSAQSDGYATACESEDACTNAESVRITFDRVQEDPQRLAGDLRLDLEDGRRIEGRFEARRIAFQALCG